MSPVHPLSAILKNAKLIALTPSAFSEITAKVARLGVRIYEVAISYHGRTYDEGKKIGWRDGFSAIRCILKYNLRRKKSKN